MSSRNLSNPEVQDLWSRHPEIQGPIGDHERLFGYYGWQTWDQTRGDVDAFGIVLPIPPRGIVVEDDEFYGDVVIFPDARGVLRYTATDNKSLVSEVQKPRYESDPDYWELFEEIASKYKDALSSGYDDLVWIVGAAALLGIAIVARKG